jgi:two-component system OmpR family response regulator
MKILLIEDDQPTAAFVEKGLREAGHEVDHSGDGREGLVLATTVVYDAAVIDRMLPGLDGMALVKTLRGAGIKTPILFLTARGGIDDRVEGLEAGADDYLGKPFALSELRARLRALLRRGAPETREPILERGRVRIDFSRRQAWAGRSEIPLTRREIDVLERLFWAKGRAVQRDDLLEELWGSATPETAASLEVIVARLRRKLDESAGGPLIRTLRGYGYALADGKHPEDA